MKRLAACVIVGLFLLATWGAVTPAQGVGTITYTSTADFDNGTKTIYFDNGSWSSVANIPIKVADPGAASYNEFVFLIGGYSNDSNTDVRAENQRYNATDNSWAQMDPMTTARWGNAVARWTDRIYSLGGRESAGVESVKNEFYNITTDSWGVGADVPISMKGQGGCAFMYNFVVYYYWGTTGGAVTTDIRSYNPNTDSWTNLADPPRQMGSWAVCGIVDSNLYVIGGSVLNGLVLRYNLVSNVWTDSYDATPVSFVAFGMARENPVLDDHIYVGFGLRSITTGPFYNKLYDYEPVGKVWTRKVHAIYERDGVAVGIVGTTFYFMGGRETLSSPQGLVHNEAFNTSTEIEQGTNGVETSSDHPSVASGVFQLGSMRTNDSFTNPVGVLHNFSWYTQTQGPETFTRDVTGGVLRLGVEEGIAYTGVMSATVNGQITGDFDFSVKTDWISGNVMRINVQNDDIPDYNAVGWTTNDGVIYHLTGSSAGAFTLSNHSLTQCGTNTAYTDPEYFRIRRVGNVYTWFLSNDGSAWTQDEQCPHWFTGNVYVSLSVIDTVQGTETRANFDDFKFDVVSYVSEFRDSGSWVSSVQTFNGEVVKTIKVTFDPGPFDPAVRRIDEIALMSNHTGETLHSICPCVATQLGDNVVTLTVSEQALAGLFGVDWFVRVTLFGDETNTVSVSNIEINTVRSLLTIATSDAPMLFVFVGILIAGLAGAAWIRNKRGGGR